MTKKERHNFFIRNEKFINDDGYMQCNSCVMDTSDGSISFNQNGVCNYCSSYEHRSNEFLIKNDGYSKLKERIQYIKKSNQKKQYDCILGVSGGFDSSYLALLLKEFNLRVLAVHVDGGWNSELAVNNIQSIVSACELDLFTHVVDWEQMKNLQLAFFKSGISNLDIPQDHVFFAVLHSMALKNNINVFMSGGNFATESILPAYWQYDAMDKIFIKAINKRFGNTNFKSFETISFFELKILFRLRGFSQLRPLNFINYGIKKALPELESIGWRNYERKHGESVFTKFFQNYFLVKRFGYDKRRPHFSSRILSGDLEREEALELLQLPLYTDFELEEDKQFISKKLSISVEQLDLFLKTPRREFHQFKNWQSLMSASSWAMKFLSN